MHAICRSVSFVVLIFAIVVRRHRLQRRSSSRAVCRCSSPQTSLVVVLRPVVPLSDLFFSHAPALCLVGRCRLYCCLQGVVVRVDAGGNGQEKSEPPRRRLRGPTRGGGHGCGERWHGVGGTAGDGVEATRRLKHTLPSTPPKYAPENASSSVPHVVKPGLLEVGGRARSLHPSDCSHVSPTVVKVLYECPAWLTPRQRFLAHKFLEGTGFVHESIGQGRRRRLVIGRGSAATTLPPNSRALPRSAISTNVCNGIERALGITNKVSTLLHSNSRNDDLKLSAWRSPQYHIIHDTHKIHTLAYTQYT